MTDTIAPLADRMGIDVLEAGPERVVARMPVEPNRQPYGLLAGGASAMLAESVASRAAALHAKAMDKSAVGVQLSVVHHASVRDGWVDAVATALHLGRTTASYQVAISGPDGKRISTATVLCMVIDRPKP